MTIYQGDCLEVMKILPDKSIDMILTDLPYGTTACHWDSVIPFEPLWEQYKRLIKDNGAIVLTASQPFTSALIMSNIKMFKYEWVWEKEQGVNFQLCKYQPLKTHETISIFSKGTHTYFPQGLVRVDIDKSNKFKGGNLRHQSSEKIRPSYKQEYKNYPKSIQKFNRETGLHPTQKPVALMEYLIKTYTNEGETVLDSCMGSGTTGIACLNTNRKFIGIEKDSKYFEIASKRIENAKGLFYKEEIAA